jgi:hypothetical protein
MQLAPISSKSLLASNFKSEPTEIHLCGIIETRKKELKRTNVISMQVEKIMLKLLRLTRLSSSHGASSPRSAQQLFDLCLHPLHLQ